MSKWIHISENGTKPFPVGEDYLSRMMLDSDMINGKRVVQINLGVFKPNKDLSVEPECSTHEGDEIYLILSGTCEITLDGEKIRPLPGDVIYIPAGVAHVVKNLSTTEPFKLFTVWDDGRLNDLYFVRKEAWNGVIYKKADEE